MALGDRWEFSRAWPTQSREAAQQVTDTYGEPDEATDALMTWHWPGQWKRIVATKALLPHDFPAPHVDTIQSVIDYRVPVDRFSDLGRFNGSIICDRTAGEVSARCHDERATCLALNLMNDIVIGRKTVQEARAYYAKEFADDGRMLPTPYMDMLRFTPVRADVGDPDTRVLSEPDVAGAEQAGEEPSQQRTGSTGHSSGWK